MVINFNVRIYPTVSVVVFENSGITHWLERFKQERKVLGSSPSHADRAPAARMSSSYNSLLLLHQQASGLQGPLNSEAKCPSRKKAL